MTESHYSNLCPLVPGLSAELPESERNDGGAGVQVDHSNIYRWAQKFTPKLEATFRKGKKRPVGKSWRMDETYIKIKGRWKYLYRAVDKEGQTVDFLLTIYRDKKAIRQHGLPDKMTIDKSGENTAALDALNDEPNVNIEVRQSK